MTKHLIYTDTSECGYGYCSLFNDIIPRMYKQLKHQNSALECRNFTGLNLHLFNFQFKERKRKREAEERKKYPLEKRIKEAIIGQEGAITVVSSGL